MNGVPEAIPIPDCDYHFELPGGRRLSVDPIEALDEAARIRQECRGREDFAHARMFADWLNRLPAGRSPRDVSPAEAERVWQALEVEYARQKKDWLETLSSLASTPAATSPGSPPPPDWDSGPT